MHLSKDEIKILKILYTGKSIAGNIFDNESLVSLKNKGFVDTKFNMFNISEYYYVINDKGKAYVENLRSAKLTNFMTFFLFPLIVGLLLKLEILDINKIIIFLKKLIGVISST